MADSLIFKVMDKFIKPQEWYEYTHPTIDGFRMIATKEDQKQAGFSLEEAQPRERTRGFGLSPVKPYRDYYGKFTLKTRLVLQELEVKFAIGYTINSKLVTIDDVSNFSWLRLCTGIEQILYPNLAHQKQLLDYILKHSCQPRFVITRVYQYLQFELYQVLTAEIMQKESGIVAGKSIAPGDNPHM